MPFDRSILVNDLVGSSARTAVFHAAPVGATLTFTPARTSFDRFRPAIDFRHLSAVPAGQDATFARSASPVPICPTGTPSDTVTYEHATDPSVRYWLPRYRIREQSGRYEIALAEDAGLWTVTFGLETFPAPEVAEAARAAQPLPHALQISIRYGVDIQRRHDAVQVTPDDRGLLAVFRMTLDERDALLRAYQSDAARAELVVSRGIDVAVPAAVASGGGAVLTLDQDVLVVQALQTVRFRQPVVEPPPVLVAEPQLELRHVRPVDPDPGQPEPIVPLDRIPLERVGVDQRMSIPALSRLAVAVPLTIQDRIVGARTSLWRLDPDDPEPPQLPSGTGIPRPHLPRPFPRPRPFPQPDPDPQPPPEPQPQPQPQPQPDPTPTPPPEPQFVRRSVGLDAVIMLRFDPTTHPYLFVAGLGGAQTAEYERVLVRFPADDPNATTYVYLQDRARPDTFHYLPDSFQLSRTTTAPYVPALAFEVEQGSTPADASVKLSCYLRPDVDAARLVAARAALAGRIPQQTGVGREPVLQPLVARSALTLGLPTGSPQPSAAIDLANGFWVSADLTMSSFQDVFAVLVAANAVSTLLRGTVSVTTGLSADDQVPVELRYADLVGEVFTATETWDEPTQTMSVALTNATESSLVVTALPVWLRRGPELVAGVVAGLDLSTPLTLAPEQKITLTVTPATPLSGTDPVDAVPDLRAVSTVVDPEVMLGLALDSAVDLDSSRSVMIMTTASALAGAGDATRGIDTIAVEFEGGQPVTLDADHLKITTDVPIPLVDVLLRRDGGGTYRYRQTVVYTTQPPAEGDWRTGDRGVLVVPVS